VKTLQRDTHYLDDTEIEKLISNEHNASNSQLAGGVISVYSGVTTTFAFS